MPDALCAWSCLHRLALLCFEKDVTPTSQPNQNPSLVKADRFHDRSQKFNWLNFHCAIGERPIDLYAEPETGLKNLSRSTFYLCICPYIFSEPDVSQRRTSLCDDSCVLKQTHVNMEWMGGGGGIRGLFMVKPIHPASSSLFSLFFLIQMKKAFKNGVWAPKTLWCLDSMEQKKTKT